VSCLTLLFWPVPVLVQSDPHFALIEVLDRAHFGPLRGEHNQRGKVSNTNQYFSPVSLRSNPSRIKVSFSSFFHLLVIEMRSAIPGNICKFPFINEILDFLNPILGYPGVLDTVKAKRYKGVFISHIE